MRQSAPLEVVLHQQRTGKSSEAVHQRSCRYRTSEMRHDTNEMSFADGRDFHHLGDSSDVGQGGTKVVDIVVFDQLVEVPTIAPLFSRSERNFYAAAEDRQILAECLIPHRIFDKERLELFDQ